MTSPQPALYQPTSNLAAANRLALRSLRRHWLLAALLFVVALGAGYAGQARSANAAHALSWLLWASVAAAAVLGILWHALPSNHRKNEDRLLADFGAATWVSLVCGLLVAATAGFLFSPMPAGRLAWAPALFYTLSRLLDFADGYLARRTNRVTQLGATLDIELDGLGLLVAVVMGVQTGRLPVWYLVLADSRQLFVAGMWLRTLQGKPVYELPPSENRRVIAGFQTGFLTLMLWPILGPPATTLAATLFAVPLIASFGRDWLVVSGAVDADSPSYLRRRVAFKHVLEGWLPLAGRVLGTLLAAALLWRSVPDFAAWQERLRQAGATEPSTLAWAVAILAAGALPFFALGIAGRVAALLLIALAFVDISATGLDWSGNVWVLVCGVLVAHFGSGFYSLWQPEERILHRRLGDSGPALR